MGVYDTYGKNGIQIKTSTDDVFMGDYSIGDKAPLEDGIYIGYEGVIVIKDGIFIAEYENLKDKWGNVLSCENVIKSNNPIAIALKDKKQSF